jgi:hypothetical protein
MIRVRSALLSALLPPALLALGCGGGGGKDAGATIWYWDSSADLRRPVDVPVAPADVNADRVYPTTAIDTAIDFDALPVCVNDGACAEDCAQLCGLHNLGRMACTCVAGGLRCGDCQPLPSARPLIPTEVTATCGTQAVTGQPCARQGDACLNHNDWEWPDGCLCWPTSAGLRWDCLNVLHWFTPAPDGGR